jgi:S-adenosylmethionine hydrolase
MSILTLTSDWNESDFYVGTLKGFLLAQLPEVQIIDISHSITPFNIAQAAFVLRNCYSHFPDGTVHLICVGVDQKKNNPIIIEFSNQYFIGADNGIAGLLFDSKPDKVYRIKDTYINKSSFFEKDTLAKAGLELLQHKTISEIADVTNEFNQQVPLRPTIDEDVISGSVVYIDSYKNLITNIPQDLFDQVGKNRKFEIFVQSNHYRISKINRQYSETAVGELLALFNVAGLLEIAINNGNAAELLSLRIGANVRVKFSNK